MRPLSRRHLVLRISGMSCRHCVRQVTAALRDVTGVEIVEADATTCHVRLRGSFVAADILAALTCGGYAAVVVADNPMTTPSHAPAVRPARGSI
ncbi:MAG: heavy-metal-associated domain-containing protein [Sporichthyaceae bacterium]